MQHRRCPRAGPRGLSHTELWMEMGAIHRDGYLLQTKQTWLPLQPDPLQTHRADLYTSYAGSPSTMPPGTMGRLNTRTYVCTHACMWVCECLWCTGQDVWSRDMKARRGILAWQKSSHWVDVITMLCKMNATHTHTHSFDQREDLLRCRQVTRDYDSKFPSPLVPTTTAKYVCGLSHHVKKKAHSSKTKTKATLKSIMQDLSDKHARWECSEITFF